MSELSEEEIDERMEKLQIWGVIDPDTIGTSVEFESYKEACFFANQVFSVAEELNHHPRVTVEYGQVNVDVTSHDADGLTERDFELAEEVEERLGRVSWT
jgi:4a-hydroxytetrahydrobiopterin dehydratase